MRQLISLVVVVCCAAAVFSVIDARKVALAHYYGKMCPSSLIIPHGQVVYDCSVNPSGTSYTCSVNCDAGFYGSEQYDSITCYDGTWGPFECLPSEGPHLKKYCQHENTLSTMRSLDEQTAIETVSGVSSVVDCVIACEKNLQCLATMFKQQHTTGAATCTLYAQAGAETICTSGFDCKIFTCVDPVPPPKQCPQVPTAGEFAHGTVIETIFGKNDSRISDAASCQSVCEYDSRCRASTYYFDETVFPAALYETRCTLFSQLKTPDVAPCADGVTCTSFSC